MKARMSETRAGSPGGKGSNCDAQENESKVSRAQA